MPIASFANKIFEVNYKKINTFDGLQYGGTLETEKQDNAGKKPSTYVKGPGLDTLTFKINIDSQFGLNPIKEIESWKIIKDRAIAHPFLIKGKPFGAPKWLLVDMQANETILDNKGNMLSALITLRFDEYVSAGKTPEKNSASSSGVKSKSTPSTESVYNALSPSKTELKRPEPTEKQLRMSYLYDGGV